MAIEPKSKRQDIQTVDEHRIIREMIVNSTQQNALAILGWEIGDEYETDPDLKLIAMRTEYYSPAYTTVVATYSDHAEDLHEEDLAPVWTYSADTVTQMIYEDLDHQQVNNPSRPADSDHWAIGANAEGTQTLAPIMNVTARVYRQYAAIQYFDDWLYLTGQTNEDGFHGMPADYWLYLGFDATPQRSVELNQRWQIVHRFSLNPASWLFTWYPTKRESYTLPLSGEIIETQERIEILPATVPRTYETVVARIYTSDDFDILGLE